MLANTFKLFVVLFFFQEFSVVSAQETSDYIVVKDVKIIGNKTTKASIILREISFNIYDTIQSENLRTFQISL